MSWNQNAEPGAVALFLLRLYNCFVSLCVSVLCLYACQCECLSLDVRYVNLRVCGVCERERERVHVCVCVFSMCEREIEKEKERERESVCACVRVCVRA